MAELFFDIETTGLFPEKSRVTCIGFLHSEYGVRVFSNKDEYQLLSEASRCLQGWLDYSLDKGGTTFVSFNGMKFDIPFVLKRFELLGSVGPVEQQPDWVCDSGPWKHFNSPLDVHSHVDLMLVLSAKYEEVMGQKLSTGRLSKDGARQWFDIYEPRAGGATHGVMIAKTQSDWAPIWLHNSLDLFTTKRLWEETRRRGWC